MLRNVTALRGLLLCAFAVACASPEPPPGSESVEKSTPDSVVPATIGVFVAPASAGVVVAAMEDDGPAAQAGMRVGDVVQRYNGVSVLDTRQFYRLVLDSVPGSRAELELLRDGAAIRVAVPVREADTAPRG
jgi:S1-C subfamily serine protease